jgi:hypothetical protein
MAEVTTVEEAEDIIRLASIYFQNAWVGVSAERARELILQAANLLHHGKA